MGKVEAGQRDYSWDAARAFLMVLGIPYHTALAYREGRQWIVNSGEGLPIFTYLAELIHLFRMPAFFLIAGYFAALLLARRAPGEWLSGRFRRLGVPLLASLVTLIPLLNIACELSNFPLEQALASWRHNASVSGGYWVRHLWFLIVLLYCCCGAAALAWSRPGLRTAVMPARIDKLMAGRLFACLLTAAVALGLWEAVAIELFYKAGLANNLVQEILRLDELIAYGPYFILGAILARSPKTLERLGRFSPALAGVAVASAAVSLVFLDHLTPAVGRFVATLAAVTLTQATIAGARRLGGRPIPLVQKVVSASFVIYLVHLPIIAVLVWLGQGVAAPVAAKALAIMALSLTLSYGAWLVARRSAWLAFLFSGEPLPARRSATGAEAVLVPMQRTWAVRMTMVFACSVGAAAHAGALPNAIRAMIANAHKTQDPQVLAAVVAVAKQTAPEHSAEIDELASGEAEAEAAPPPQEQQVLALAIPPPRPAPQWKGAVELGGSQSTGSNAAVAAHGAIDLSRSSAAWTHRLTASAEYLDTAGVPSTERLALAYQPQINFQPGLYAYGLGQYEHDSVVGYRNRYSLGVGVGVNLADQPDFKVALDVGPALRRTEYFQDQPNEAALAGRAGLNLKWLPTDRVTIGQETAFYLDGEKNTLKSLVALDTVLFGPLKGRVSYNVQREQGGPADRPSVDTTTRASLLYSF